MNKIKSVGVTSMLLDSRRVQFSISAIIFCVISFFGFVIAINKPFWTDETTYLSNMYASPFHFIFLGKHMVDANPFPLFHLVSRVYSDFLLLLNISWPGLDFETQDHGYLFSQIIFRVPSNLSISFAVAFSFYFYSRHFSPAVGGLTALASAGVFPMWYHIAESRVYAIWYLLATLQLCYLLGIHKTKGKDRHFWNMLIVIQFLMCLHTAFSIFHILVAAVFLWVSGLRNNKYYLMCVTQGVVWLFYFLHIPEGGYHFSERGQPHNLVLAHFKSERFLMLFVFLGCYFYSMVKYRKDVTKKELYTKLSEGWPVSLICIMMLVCVGIALVKFSITKPAGYASGDIGFEVPNRYFFYLAPLSSISFAMLATICFKAFDRYKLMQFNLVCFIGIAFIYRINKTYSLAVSTWF